MLGAQSQIDEIGDTTDPALLSDLNKLEGQRDIFLVSSIGFVFLGVFGVFVLSERSMPVTVSRAQMLAAARAGRDITRGLSLTGNAMYLPRRKGLTRERMFVPAPTGQAVAPAALTDDLTVSPGKDGSTPGMLVEPYGLGLLDTIEEEGGTGFADIGLEAAEGSLQVMKHSLNLLRDFHFKERDGRTVLRVEHKDLLDACREVRKEMPDTCRQGACVGCSCLLTAAARATGKIVSVERVDNAQDQVVFTLELRDW
jgi:ferredoxin